MDPTHYHFLSSQHYCMFGNRGCRDIALNIYETDESLIIIADVSGAQIDSLHIDITEQLIHVRGTRHAPPPANLRRIHRMEIAAGQFEFQVPINTAHVAINTNNATSHYVNGLLEIHLPYRERVSQRIVVPVTEGADTP